MNTTMQMIGCLLASALFALLFRTPARLIAPASVTAVMGYALSVWSGRELNAEWAGIFLGSLAAALVGEFLATRLRAPATIFLTVAVIPLVPGAGLYNTMLALVQGRSADAAAAGASTILAAGGIALGLSIAASAAYAIRRARKGRIP